jgi:hypothetical protein
MDPSVKKIIVAVHGIGDQTQFATVQQVLAQFSRYFGGTAAVPLGNFQATGNSVAYTPKVPPKLCDFGFAEVYWADIPREVVQQGHVLEDIQPWVKTIIGRVHQRQLESLKGRQLTDADERMIEQVLGEMLQTIDVLERLCFLADKMGIFSFDLKQVLVDFLDDVQIVAEFRDQGQKIGKIFADQMQALYGQFQSAEEIYIVAHSEGTVVSLLGLLTALCAKDNPWISKVRGLMTFGSPIDKHLTLWPELFAEFEKPCGEIRPPIPWHNYYDFGDPIGFALETARQRFATGDWGRVFDFPVANDHGFARYPLPGKAHNDYWQDADVFDHFIDNVVEAPIESGKHKKVPASKTQARIVSWVLPYMVATALLFCAVLVLYKAVHGFLRPDELKEGLLPVFSTVSGISCLLAGITVMARMPRLTRVWSWRLFGGFFFLLSILGYRIFSCLRLGIDNFGLCLGTFPRPGEWGLAGIAIVLVGAIYLVSALYPKLGMRALLIPGALAVVYVACQHLDDSPTHGNLWPVFPAGAIFLYLWWLVALLFDLTFVWHRYIRFAVPIGERRKKKAVNRV